MLAKANFLGLIMKLKVGGWVAGWTHHSQSLVPVPIRGSGVPLAPVMGTLFDPISITNRVNMCVYCLDPNQAIYYLRLWTDGQEGRGSTNQPPDQRTAI